MCPLGTTRVECTAWDASGNTNQCAFEVAILDSQPPQLACPGTFTLLRTRSEGAVLLYEMPVIDNGDANLVVESSAPPGTTLGSGTNHVALSAVDASGNRAVCTFDVVVIDPDPGHITRFDAAHGTFNLSFPTQPGVQYEVEYKDSLDDPQWQPLATIEGDGTLTSISDVDLTTPIRFYRVRAP
jgi:hypothetical protein